MLIFLPYVSRVSHPPYSPGARNDKQGRVVVWVRASPAHHSHPKPVGALPLGVSRAPPHAAFLSPP